MGPILYGFICDLASNLGEVLHADEYVLGLDKQRTSEMHLRSFSLSLSSAEASLVSLSHPLFHYNHHLFLHIHTQKKLLMIKIVLAAFGSSFAREWFKISRSSI